MNNSLIRYYFDLYLSGIEDVKECIADTTTGQYNARYMLEEKIKEDYPNKTFILVLKDTKMLVA